MIYGFNYKNTSKTYKIYYRERARQTFICIKYIFIYEKHKKKICILYVLFKYLKE